jgi:hypothetical protein
MASSNRVSVDSKYLRPRVWLSFDAGTIVNRDRVRAQSL